jgi:[ribosomal protein S18]-alanine N-acetyltransferase
MIELNYFKSPEDLIPQFSQNQLIDFLSQHLDQYGDERTAIQKCMDYALGLDQKLGGLVLTASDSSNNILAGVAIVNKTGMDEYIPGNILVYIAVDAAYRGQGIGKQMVKKIINLSEGGIALHVEPDNPARFLYASLGFTNKYLEMRFEEKN